MAASGGLAPAQSEGGPTMQFGFKGSERLLARKAWEAADAFRPGKPNELPRPRKFGWNRVHDE